MSYTYWFKPLTEEVDVGWVDNVQSLQSVMTPDHPECVDPYEFPSLGSMLGNMGWEVVDTNYVDATNDDGWTRHVPVAGDYRVWKTTGESGDKVPGFLHVWVDSSLKLNVEACGYWSATSHTAKQVASRTGWTNAAMTLPATVGMWGDKDQIVLRVGTEVFACGHVPLRWANCAFKTVTTGALSVSASPVTVGVESVEGFAAGMNLQILSHDASLSGLCTDWVNVTAVDGTANTLTLASTALACAAGAHVGVCPLAFYHAYKAGSDLVYRWTHYKNVTGDTADESYGDPKAGSMYSVTDSMLDGRTNAFNLEPLAFHDKTYPGSAATHNGFILGVGDGRVLRYVTDQALDVTAGSVFSQNTVFAGSGTWAGPDTVVATLPSTDFSDFSVVVSKPGMAAKVGRIVLNDTSHMELSVEAAGLDDSDAVDFVVCRYAFREVSGLSARGLLLAANEGRHVAPLAEEATVGRLKRYFVI